MNSVTLKTGNLSQGYLLLKIPMGFPLFLSSPVLALWVPGLCSLRHIPYGTFVFLVGWSFYHLRSHPILPKWLSLCFMLWAVWYLHIDCLLHGVSSSIHLLHLSYKWVQSEFVTNRIYLGDMVIDYARLCDSTDVFRASVDALKIGGIEVIYYLSPPPFLWFCLFYFFMWLEHIKDYLDLSIVFLWSKYVIDMCEILNELIKTYTFFGLFLLNYSRLLLFWVQKYLLDMIFQVGDC